MPKSNNVEFCGIKILRLSNMAGYTSAPLNSFSIYRAKHYSDEDITYVAFRSSDKDYIRHVNRDEQTLGKLYVEDAGGSFLAYFRLVRKWAKSIVNEKSAVVHGHQPGSTVAGLIALSFQKKRIPLIYTVHNSMQNFTLFKRFLLFVCLYRASRITFVSHSSYESFRIVLGRRLLEKSDVIRNGVDLERVNAVLKGLHTSTRDRDDRAFKVVCVGRLSLQKNLSFLVRLFAELPDSACLDIFGDGPLREKLQTEIVQAGAESRVVLRGNVPREELYQSVSEADLYVSVATFEGLPMAVLEALAIGRPCLVSDIQPHNEIKQLVPTLEVLPHDKPVWIARLNKIMDMEESQREKIGLLNRHHIENSLTMKRMQDNYREIYDSLTSG